MSYDPWGKRRHANGADDLAGSLTSTTTRGFTGHEMLDSLDLVHMNGRIYDPIIGRFMSADPITEAPNSSQGWNRYSYVGNSPVNFTDPSGYCFMGCGGKGFFGKLGALLRKYPIIGTIIKVAMVAMCAGPGISVCAVAMSFVSSAFVTGVSGGSLADSLKAGLFAAVQVLAFDMIGSNLPGGRTPAFGTPGYVAKIASHAALGCLSAAAMGGKCGQGAAGAAASAAASPFMPGGLLGIGASAAVGGAAAVAAGGSFKQGAMNAFAGAATTAAFGYMYNAGGHEDEKQRVAKYLRDRGLIVETEVDLRLAGTGYATKADIMVMQPGVPSTLRIIEIKIGTDNYTDDQRWVYPSAVHGGLVMGTTSAISKFGYSPGQILPPIPVFEMYKLNRSDNNFQTTIMPPIIPYPLSPGDIHRRR